MCSELIMFSFFCSSHFCQSIYPYTCTGALYFLPVQNVRYQSKCQVAVSLEEAMMIIIVGFSVAASILDSTL